MAADEIHRVGSLGDVDAHLAARHEDIDGVVVVHVEQHAVPRGRCRELVHLGPEALQLAAGLAQCVRETVVLAARGRELSLDLEERGLEFPRPVRPGRESLAQLFDLGLEEGALVVGHGGQAIA